MRIDKELDRILADVRTCSPLYSERTHNDSMRLLALENAVIDLIAVIRVMNITSIL